MSTNRERLHAAQREALGAGVAVIKIAFVLLLGFFSTNLFAAVLPEERVDFLYHSYDGGGVTVDGPSLLVRKNFKEKVSVYGNLYQDFVTSASIDVLTSGSPYTEERNETSVGVDLLNEKNILSLGYTQSIESDYLAQTLSFSTSQEFFGDLTTITMGYVFGNDIVRQNGNDTFEETNSRKRFNLGFSQILSRNILVSSSFEIVLDEGYLSNPYRQIRYLNDDGDVEYGEENYPDTRNSSAFAQRAIFYIPPVDASIRLEYRQYQDSWDIKSANTEIRYSQNIDNKLTLELRARNYSQGEASFYEDLFTSQPTTEQYAGRDKELSEYSASQFGWSLSYNFSSRFNFLNNSSINLAWDRFYFSYDNFRNIETGVDYEPGEEPTYDLRADVIRLFFSSYF